MHVIYNLKKHSHNFWRHALLLLFGFSPIPFTAFVNSFYDAYPTGTYMYSMCLNLTKNSQLDFRNSSYVGLTQSPRNKNHLNKRTNFTQSYWSQRVDFHPLKVYMQKISHTQVISGSTDEYSFVSKKYLHWLCKKLEGITNLLKKKKHTKNIIFHIIIIYKVHGPSHGFH